MIPDGFIAETVFPECFRMDSAEKHGFWSIPERFHRRNSVSGVIPGGFIAETVFPE